MRLFNGQVPVIADEVLRLVTKEGDIEVTEENLPEVKLDVESVLKEWIRMEREVMEEARDLAAMDSSMSIGRAKYQVARKHNFKVGDEAIGYLINQMIETFMYSNYVEEVYADDVTLRKRIQPILARHTQLQDTLDLEVRNRLKNLKEGSQTWDIEYQKAMESLRRSKKLD